eukprot:TRINITY_DN574_c0_g1_i1.p2 TRINITY_DN574_c0_g1~~TRINITY_DN574_c0_g1_i1.p2  ORF type:complete len:125 (+),score=0.48 TRINITY_DN574_c0_g1_i1:222-596(+)
MPLARQLASRTRSRQGILHRAKHPPQVDYPVLTLLALVKDHTMWNREVRRPRYLHSTSNARVMSSIVAGDCMSLSIAGAARDKVGGIHGCTRDVRRESHVVTYRSRAKGNKLRRGSKLCPKRKV